MRRGDVYDARLNPSEGSEQSGKRPVIVVSRDAINESSPVVIIVPVTSAANISRQYPSNVLITEGHGGLAMDSVALGGQIRAISRTRLLRHRGALPLTVMDQLDRALRITLDL